MTQALPISQTSTVPAVDAAATKPARAKVRERVDYIEYFRALTIVMIIFGHAFDLAWTREVNEHVPLTEPVLRFVSALVNGGTFYFVFISGFLYRHVFFERVAFGDFMWKKVQYVGSPYLLIGTVLALIQVVLAGFHVTIYKHGGVLGENLFVDVVTQLATGAMMTAYWYIPFIFVVFAASPLFDRFIRLPAGARIGLTILATVVAFWVHRPYENLNPLHCFVYFASFYMFGILFCEFRAQLMPVLKSSAWLIALGLGLVVIILVQDLVLHQIGNVERSLGDGWLPKALDLIIVQKYVGILFFCGVLARWGDYLGRSLAFIAGISFGLYFVHGIVLTAMTHMPSRLSPHVGASLADFTIYAVFTLGISIAIVMVVRQLSGSYSRFVIGS
jgi:peptidoglycan/LPS O-acetylase OafA/YrhL